MSLAPDLVDLAVRHGGGDAAQCETTVHDAIEQQKSPLLALLDAAGLDEVPFLQSVATKLHLPWWETDSDGIPAQVREIFPARLALRYQLLPVRAPDETLWVLTYDPFNLLARQAVQHAVSPPVRWAMASRRQILQSLRSGYGIGADTFEQIIDGRESDEALDNLKQETMVLDAEDEEASVARFVNQVMREALEEGATDIHVEPLENDLRIRYRIDGVLHEVPVPEQIKQLQASVISRLKILAHLDIAERRLPQDGRINLELAGQAIDVRVATIPSVTGESVSLRLLGQEKFEFDRLGLDTKSRQTIMDLMALPNGIILVTGPTGSGKSTSLYTFLTFLNTKERRIVTIEDPVEHKLPGVVQIPVKPEISLTFAAGLRSILRGDPNVIMVGEMRDLETAEIAIRAALTGHLVLSTLHTNDAIGGVTRLIDMGLEPFLVASSVRAFLAQRLVRRLCPHCKQPGNYNLDYLAEIGLPREKAGTLYRAVGCDRCRRTGYSGRLALYEIVIISKQMEDLIIQRKPASTLRQTALSEGMIPLRHYGFQKAMDGLTTIEEVLRVTTADLAALDE